VKVDRSKYATTSLDELIKHLAQDADTSEWPDPAEDVDGWIERLAEATSAAAIDGILKKHSINAAATQRKTVKIGRLLDVAAGA